MELFQTLPSMRELRQDSRAWWELLKQVHSTLPSAELGQCLVELAAKFQQLTVDWETYCQECTDQSTELRVRTHQLKRRLANGFSQSNQLLDLEHLQLNQSLQEWGTVLSHTSRLWASNIQHLQASARQQKRSPVPGLDLARANAASFKEDSELISNRSPFSSRSEVADLYGQPKRGPKPVLPKLPPGLENLLEDFKKPMRPTGVTSEGELEGSSLDLTTPRSAVGRPGDLQQTVLSSELPLSARDQNIEADALPKAARLAADLKENWPVDWWRA